jgi:putative FmdB family regulatory protein
MPIYEYICRACGRPFEHLHRRLNEPAPACPACGAKKAAKQFSSFSAKVGGSQMEMPPCASGGCCSRKCPSAGECNL